MRRAYIAMALMVLFSISACAQPSVTHEKALVKDGSDLKIINVKGGPGTLLATIPIPGLRKAVVLPGTSTAFAVANSGIYVIDTISYSYYAIPAPVQYHATDIHIPANGVPYVLLDQYVRGFSGERWEKLRTLEETGGTWDWGTTWNFAKRTLIDIEEVDTLLVTSDGSEAIVLGERLNIGLAFNNISLTGSFDDYENTVSTCLFGKDMVFSPDETLVYIVDNSGLAVFATGRGGLVRHYHHREFAGSKWGFDEGGKKIDISLSGNFLYIATEGFLDINGGGFILKTAKLKVGDDPLVVDEDVFNIGMLPLPDDFTWLAELFAFTLSFNDVTLSGGYAHFVLTSLVGSLPLGLPYGLHMVVEGNRIVGLSLLCETDNSTPVRVEGSNADAVLITNSAGGYINRILADPLLGFLPGKVEEIADDALNNPSSFALSEM